MAVETQSDAARAVQLTRLFIEALNARDVDGLAEISDEAIELRHPRGGAPLRGREGLERVVLAAVDADLVLVRVGEPEVNSQNGVTRVTQWVKEITRGARIRATANFEIRGEKITGLEIESDLVRPDD